MDIEKEKIKKELEVTRNTRNDLLNRVTELTVIIELLEKQTLELKQKIETFQKSTPSETTENKMSEQKV